MPIDMETFANGNEPTVRKSKVRPEIEEYLYRNAEQAFCTKDISTELEVVNATANHTLNKLVEDGLAEKRQSDNTNYYHWIGGIPASLQEDADEPEDLE